MNEVFINFSRLKLNEAPVNPVAVEKQGSEAASLGGQTQSDGTHRRREAQGLQMAAKTGSPRQATTVQKAVVEHLEDIRNEKEFNRLYKANMSDWRAELTEALEDDPMEPEHPYVKVMPNIKYKQIEAEKELMAAAKGGNKQIKEDKDEDKEISRRAASLRKAIASSDRAGKEASRHHDKALKAKKKGDKVAAHKHQRKANSAANKARDAKAAAVRLDPIGSKRYARKDNPSLTNKTYHRDLKTRKGRKKIVMRSMASQALKT